MRREIGNMLAEWIEKLPSPTRNTLRHVLGVYLHVELNNSQKTLHLN